MSNKNSSFGDLDAAKDKMEEMQKIQTRFVSTMWSKGMELQQKQYTLLTSILQNQIEFGNALLSGAMSMNDNLRDPDQKSVRKK